MARLSDQILAMFNDQADKRIDLPEYYRYKVTARVGNFVDEFVVK